MRLNTEAEVLAYYEGQIVGVRRYAWWKDGIQFVGSSGRTFLQAELEFLRQRDEARKAFSEGREIYSS